MGQFRLFAAKICKGDVHLSSYHQVNFNTNFSLLVAAIKLLKACRGNLEMAVELHFSKQEAMPDLEQAVGDVAMETSSCSMTSSGVSLGTPDKSEDWSSCPAEGINESILSLLVKLMSVMVNTSSSSPGRLVKHGLQYHW